MKFRNVSAGQSQLVAALARVSRVFVALALGGVIAAGGMRAAEIWRLDQLGEIGGHPVKVVGRPRVAPKDATSAVIFDGAHDGVFVAALPIAGAQTFTIEVLLCPAESGGEAQRFFHLEDKAGRRALLELRTDGRDWWLDAFVRAEANSDDKGLTLIDPKRRHPTGRWYWVAMRCDGRRMSSFVNGVKELEGDKTFVPFTDGTVSLGVRQNLVYWFKGAIREVRFHREAISAEQLQRIALSQDQDISHRGHGAQTQRPQSITTCSAP